MRIAESERRDLSFYVRAIADAHDVELSGEARRNALYRIRGQRPCESVQRRLIIGIAVNLENAGLLLSANALGNRHFEGPLGSLHLQSVAALDLPDLNLNAGRQRNRLLTYSGQMSLSNDGHAATSRVSCAPEQTRLVAASLTKPCTKFPRRRLPCAPSGPSSRRARWSGC